MMSEEENSPGTSHDTTSVESQQIVRVSDLQTTVDAMVKWALEAASTSATGRGATSSGTDGESLLYFLSWAG